MFIYFQPVRLCLKKDQWCKLFFYPQILLKNQKIRPSVPIVLCTGFSLEISGSKKKDSCVDALIMKPISRKELSGVITTVLGDGEV